MYVIKNELDHGQKIPDPQHSIQLYVHCAMCISRTHHLYVNQLFLKINIIASNNLHSKRQKWDNGK
jgi:hypothetical protein